LPARSKARKRALDLLYEADIRSADPVVLLASREVPAYAGALVTGVARHRTEIDELLSAYAEGWTLDRMPPVDRNVLRLGAYEVLWCRDEVPVGVAISEAVELARSLSTEESPKYVNGLLAKLAATEPVRVT
jgi:transcription antitermination protein NusB